MTRSLQGLKKQYYKNGYKRKKIIEQMTQMVYKREAVSWLAYRFYVYLIQILYEETGLLIC